MGITVDVYTYVYFGSPGGDHTKRPIAVFGSRASRVILFFYPLLSSNTNTYGSTVPYSTTILRTTTTLAF